MMLNMRILLLQLSSCDVILHHHHLLKTIMSAVKLSIKEEEFKEIEQRKNKGESGGEVSCEKNEKENEIIEEKLFIIRLKYDISDKGRKK